MRELNHDGSLKNTGALLVEQGFTVGRHVRRRSDKQEGQIVEVLGEKVRLDMDGACRKVAVDSFLQGEWVVFTPKPEPTSWEPAMDFLPSSSPEWMAAVHAVPERRE